MKDAVSRLGVLNSLDLHSTDSTSDSTNATATIFRAATATDSAIAPTVASDDMPHGKNIEPSMAMNMVSLSMLENSMNARPRPEYSSIMASWTMVSSRCVVGLSKGILAFSARRVIMNDAPASMRAGPTAASPMAEMADDMLPMSVPAPESTARVAMDRSSAGSMSTDIIISLLLPMPPNVDPPSSPPRTMANLNIVRI